MRHALDGLATGRLMGARILLQAVGSIFVVFPGATPIGRKGKEAVAAAYAIYGPRTLLVLALRDPSSGASVVQEFQYSSSKGGWVRTKQSFQVTAFVYTQLVNQPDPRPVDCQAAAAPPSLTSDTCLLPPAVQLRERKYFAPANLRAAAENQRYKAAVDSWIKEGYTLR